MIYSIKRFSLEEKLFGSKRYGRGDQKGTYRPQQNTSLADRFKARSTNSQVTQTAQIPTIGTSVNSTTSKTASPFLSNTQTNITTPTYTSGLTLSSGAATEGFYEAPGTYKQQPGFFGKMKNRISEVTTGAKQKAGSIMSGIKTSATNTYNNATSRAGQIAGNVKEKTGSIMSNIGEKFKKNPKETDQNISTSPELPNNQQSAVQTNTPATQGVSTNPEPSKQPAPASTNPESPKPKPVEGNPTVTSKTPTTPTTPPVKPSLKPKAETVTRVTENATKKGFKLGAGSKAALLGAGVVGTVYGLNKLGNSAKKDEYKD